MTTINSLHISITELARSKIFDLISTIRLRRATPITPKKKKPAKKRTPKTTDPTILFNSLSATDKQALKIKLMEQLKKS